MLFRSLRDGGSLEVHAQEMFAGGVGHALVDLNLGLAAPIVEALLEPPPWDPAAEGEIRPVRWVIDAGGGGDRPGYLGVGQRIAGVVFGLDGQDGMAADEIWPTGLVAR